jgi:hypothetical protein
MPAWLDPVVLPGDRQERLDAGPRCPDDVRTVALADPLLERIGPAGTCPKSHGLLPEKTK